MHLLSYSLAFILELIIKVFPGNVAKRDWVIPQHSNRICQNGMLRLGNAGILYVRKYHVKCAFYGNYFSGNFTRHIKFLASCPYSRKFDLSATL